MPHNINTWHAIFEPKSKLCCRLTQRNSRSIRIRLLLRKVFENYGEFRLKRITTIQIRIETTLLPSGIYFEFVLIACLLDLIPRNVFGNWWKWNDEKKTQLFCVNIALKCRLNSRIFFCEIKTFFHCHPTFFLAALLSP